MIVILTIGAPGSGKSTWGRSSPKITGTFTCPLTAIVPEWDEARKTRKRLPVPLPFLKEEMGAALNDGENVVVDACFASKKARRDFVNIARGAGAHLRAVAFELPREVILERNAKRAANGGRDVPTFVIDRMLGNYQKPDSPEFDEVTIIKD